MTPIESKDAESTKTPTLHASVRDGVFNAISVGAGESYLSAFGIFLQATPVQIGTLATLPPLIGSVFQSIGVWSIDTFQGYRRLLISRSAFLHALTWIPILLLPFVFGPSPETVPYLIAMAVLYYCLAGFGVPIWNSLIGDLVPPLERGNFFGYRNKVCGLATFAAMICGGLILELGKALELVALGFAAIFVISCVARIRSAYWLTRYDDLPYRPSAAHRFSFWDFIRRTPHSNFARFVVFVSIMNFSVQVAGPFFSVYMLRDLGMSYVQLMSITATQVFAQFITIQRWGKFSDRFGNKKILNISAIGVALCPLIWLSTQNFWYILVFHLYCGFVWAGFNLAAANFMFDAVSPPKRARCSAYQSMINGAFVFLGSVCGGSIASTVSSTHLTTLFSHLPASPYPILFTISLVVRCIVVGVFLRLFREVREVEVIKHRDLIFQITHLRPMAGSTFGVVTGFIRSRRGRGLKG